jgi:hypothetical protein
VKIPYQKMTFHGGCAQPAGRSEPWAEEVSLYLLILIVLFNHPLFSVAIFLGVWNCIGIMFGDVGSLLSGLWQMIAGFFVIVCEAPCCCMFVDFVQNLSDMIEKRPLWNKAAIYVG